MENKNEGGSTPETMGQKCTKREIIRLNDDMDKVIREVFPGGIVVAAQTICPKHGHGFIMIARPDTTAVMEADRAFCTITGLLEFNKLFGPGVDYLRLLLKIRDTLGDRIKEAESDAGFEPPKPWTPESDNDVN